MAYPVIKALATSFKDYVIALYQRLRVDHAWFRTTQCTIRPDDGLVANNRKLVDTVTRSGDGVGNDGVQ